MSELEVIEGNVVDGLALPELATLANEAHARANEAGRSMVTHAIEAGDALTQAKQQVSHGDWRPWLEANFDGSERTAQDYMRIARSNAQSSAGLINGESTILGALKAIRAQAAQSEARGRNPDPISDPMAVPDGKYQCIVLDPPWPMQKIERDERPDQGVALDYPTMSLDDLADESLVPVRTLADDDCHIYLWVTHKFLPAGMELLEAWGFNYQCVMTWRKPSGAEAEMPKLRHGYGDLTIYGFESEPGSDRMYPWLIGNTAILRDYLNSGGYYKVQRNRDGSSRLAAVHLADMPLGFVLDQAGLTTWDRERVWEQCRRCWWWRGRGGVVFPTDDDRNIGVAGYGRWCPACGLWWRSGWVMEATRPAEAQAAS